MELLVSKRSAVHPKEASAYMCCLFSNKSYYPDHTISPH